METATAAVTVELVDSVGVVTFDDGRVNALSYDTLRLAREAVASAREASTSLVIAGRSGILSAGFDLKEVIKGEAERNAIITEGGGLFGDLFACPLPVVIACTGHAVAGGAVFLLVGDSRIGTRGEFKIGFNETSIGVPMPEFGIALSQYRLSPRFAEAALLGDLYSPESAVNTGFLDEITDPGETVNRAIGRAQELSARNNFAYGETKLAARRDLIERFKR